MQSLGGQNMFLDQGMQRLEQLGHRAHLVCERGEAEIHALAGIAFGPAVQRLVLAELLEQGDAAYFCGTEIADDWQPPDEISSEEWAGFVGDLVPYLKKLYTSPDAEADLVEAHRGG